MLTRVWQYGSRLGGRIARTSQRIYSAFCWFAGHAKAGARFYWRNFTLTTSSLLFVSYHAHYRNTWFIDRKNRTLRPVTLQKEMDAWFKNRCIESLRELVLKDQTMIDYTATFLLKLVREDEYTKKLMTDLFIELLHGPEFNKEARVVVHWAVLNWLSIDELGQK